MENRQFLLVGCLLVSSIIFSQQITLQGEITNNIEVEGIHVLNETSRLNSVTNQIGEFVIGVNLGDILLFSSVKYQLQEIVITEEIYHQKRIFVTLEVLVNELDEVIIGNTLTGNLAYDIGKIKAEEEFNFDDVGIPGFKGIPEERIIPPVEAFFPTKIQIEAVYKHITGYYKNLKTKRRWTKENIAVAQIIDYFGYLFFEEAYNLPQNRVYNFLLFSIETTSLQSDFNRQNFAGVLDIFEENSKEFLLRITETEN